jgi:sulfhydrogenase subunit delta
MATKPKLAVFKFASCDGCQLSLLDAEDELLAVAENVDIAYFLEARTQESAGPYDVGLVEGSVTTAHDAERIKQIRQQCKYLVTIGACATAGGIQALRNWGDVDEFLQVVYARPEYIQTLKTSTPISDHVLVDFELRGCPINKNQLVDVIKAFTQGRAPSVPPHSVCLDCKRKGVVCVMVARGVPCMGPVTHTGCGVLCPSYSRGCYGCFGPKENPNTESLANRFVRLGSAHSDILRSFRNFNSDAPAFRAESERQEERQ